MCRILLDFGANIEAEDVSQVSPLSWATKKEKSEQNQHHEEDSDKKGKLKDYRDIISILLEKGAVVKKGDYDFELYVTDHPDYLFINSSILPCTKSPIKVLNDMYKEGTNGNKSKITEIIRKYLEANYENLFSYIFTYQNSLVKASKTNLLEELDLKEKIKQIDNLLTEVFKSEKLDSMDHVLQLLFPDIDFKIYDNEEYHQKQFLRTHYAHAIMRDNGIIQYCIENELKIIFQFSQISGVINTVFYSCLPPTKLLSDEEKDSNHYYFSSKWDDFILEIDREKVQFILNMRYCPAAMFVLESIAKLTTLILVSVLVVPYNYNKNTYKIGLIAMEVGNIVYEVGQLQMNNFNLSKHFDDWNILDTISTLLLLIWLGLSFNSEYTGLSNTFLSLSAIPLSFEIIQFMSLNKSIGQLFIMIKAMCYDVFSFLALYLVCTYGFAVTLFGLFYESDANYISIRTSFITLYSATLGNFSFLDFEPFDETIRMLGAVLLVVYLLGSSIMLINLLIAR